MERPKLLFIVDACLGLAFLSVALTGILKSRFMFSLTRTLPWYIITPVHDWSGIALVVCAILHIVLHWQWIVAMTKKYFGKKQPEAVAPSNVE
jgi:hypothetical protein